MSNIPRISLPLNGPSILLRPLQHEDAPARVNAAADGQLWKPGYTVVPSAQTVADYTSQAIAGRQLGTVMPFAM